MAIAWTLTTGDLITEASQRIQMVGQNQTLSAYQMARGKSHLNALLKLAETTTPGGRPISFMSPLLTTNLRHITHGSKST